MTIALQGLREVAIDNLIVSDEFPLRLERPHVRELADSIHELGCIHPPLARQEPDGAYTVGPGEDRVAAHVLLGLPAVTVRLIACEDHELELLREAENRMRRKESPAELLEMVERLTAERDRARELEASASSDATALRDELSELEAKAGGVAVAAMVRDNTPLAPLVDGDYSVVLGDDGKFRVEQPDDDGLIDEDPPPRKGGKPKTDRMRAVERVAAQTGRPVETVRKAVEREERRREKASIELWGREQPPEWLEPVLALRAAISGVYDRLKGAAGTLTKTRLDLGDEREALKTTARAIRSRRPAAVCAWCKNVDRYVVDCTACKGVGWISEEMLEQVPEALRDPRKAMVQGQEVELEWEPLAIVATAQELADMSENNEHEEDLGLAAMDERSEDAQCLACGLTADLCECAESFAGSVGVDPEAEYEPDNPSPEDLGL